MWLCLVRLKREGKDGSLVIREVVTTFWHDVKQRMRVLGVSCVGVELGVEEIEIVLGSVLDSVQLVFQCVILISWEWAWGTTLCYVMQGDKLASSKAITHLHISNV